MFREKATIIELLIDLFLWMALLILLHPVLSPPHVLQRKRKYLAYIFLLLFCLFPFFGGDYYHYLEIFNNTKAGISQHLEDIYVWYIVNFCESYHIFRLGVWGLALILTISAYKHLRVISDLAFFYFAVFYILWFSYARVSLAMAAIFWGICFIAKPIQKIKYLSYGIGFLVMGSSVFFHRSASIGIIAAIMALLFKNPNKKTVFFLCIMFPISLYFLQSFLIDFMEMDLDYDDYISGRFRDDYLTSDKKGGLSLGIGPYISVFFTRSPLFLIGYAYIYSAITGIFKMFPLYSKIISSYAFLIILMSFAFLFDYGYNTYTLYYRTLNFAMIPSSVFLAQIKVTNCMPHLYKLIYYTTLFGVFYTLVYNAYTTLIVI